MHAHGLEAVQLREHGGEQVLPGVLLHVVDARLPGDAALPPRARGQRHRFRQHVRDPVALVHHVHHAHAGQLARVVRLPAGGGVERGAIQVDAPSVCGHLRHVRVERAEVGVVVVESRGHDGREYIARGLRFHAPPVSACVGRLSSLTGPGRGRGALPPPPGHRNVPASGTTREHPAPHSHTRETAMGRSLILRLGVLLALAPAHAQAQVQVQGGVGAEGQSTVPPLAALVAAPASELRDVVERYAADRAVLLRRYDAPYSPERQRRMREFYQAWQARLRELDFDRLGVEGRIDYILLEHELRYELALLDREERVFAETESLLPFARTILSLHDARRRHETIDPRAAADTLAGLLRAIDGAREAAAAVQRGTTSGTRTVASSDGAAKAADEERLRGYRSRVVAYRAAVIVDSLRQVLRRWNGFHAGYDPLFT